MEGQHKKPINLMHFTNPESKRLVMQGFICLQCGCLCKCEQDVGNTRNVWYPADVLDKQTNMIAQTAKIDAISDDEAGGADPETGSEASRTLAHLLRRLDRFHPDGLLLRCHHKTTSPRMRLCWPRRKVPSPSSDITLLTRRAMATRSCTGLRDCFRTMCRRCSRSWFYS